MARRTKIFFATDVHGSSKCFRKFVNAGLFYGADVLILGGDITGKALQTIVRGQGDRWRCTFIGTRYDVSSGPDLEGLEKLIADHGYYPYRAEPGELDARRADGSLDRLFVRLMRERLGAWLALAEERLRPTGKPLFFMLGNDDPAELLPLLEGAGYGTQAEGKVVDLDGEHEMASWGYSNITPWHSHREMTEEQLGEALGSLTARFADQDPALARGGASDGPVQVGRTSSHRGRDHCTGV